MLKYVLKKLQNYHPNAVNKFKALSEFKWQSRVWGDFAGLILDCCWSFGNSGN